MSRRVVDKGLAKSHMMKLTHSPGETDTLKPEQNLETTSVNKHEVL